MRLLLTKFVIVGIAFLNVDVMAQELNTGKGEFVLNYEMNLKREISDDDDSKANLITVDLSTLECNFVVNDFIDSRQNKETIGINFRTPLLAQEVDSWVSQLSQGLRQEIQSKAANGIRTVRIQPEMTRLYTYPQSLNLLGVIAMRVAFEVDGKPPVIVNYRGFAAKTNWANGIGEYNTAVNLAAANLAASFINELPSVCSSVS